MVSTSFSLSPFPSSPPPPPPPPPPPLVSAECVLSSVIEQREFRTLVATLEHHQYIKPIQVPGLKALERVLEKGEGNVTWGAG